MLQRLIDLEQQENKDKEQFEEKRKIIISSSFIVTTCELRWLMANHNFASSLLFLSWNTWITEML